MANKKKKYSLNDRLKYHDSVCERILKKGNKTDGSFDYSGVKSSKYQYSSGFRQTISRGRPLDFSERSDSYKKGCLAAEKALRKAFSHKF